MSSELQSALEYVKGPSSYASIAILTAVGYDYILTFSREVDYVWRRPFTWVSVLFIVVRYVGLCWLTTLSLLGGAFIPGPVKVSILASQLGFWGYSLFLAAADLVMILRVHALCGRSTTVLGILLVIYASQMVITFVWDAVYDNPDRVSVTVVHVLDFTYCSYLSHMTVFLETYRAIPRFLLGAMLLILAVIAILRQVVEMYNSTRQWQIGWTMKLLAREGAVYFLLNLLFIVHELLQLGSSPSVGPALFLDIPSYPLSCAIMPRFIINIRESYDHGLDNRWEGMDTGFGMLSQLSYSENTTMPGSTLGDGTVGMEEARATDGDVDGSGEHPFEIVEDGASRV